MQLLNAKPIGELRVLGQLLLSLECEVVGLKKFPKTYENIVAPPISGSGMRMEADNDKISMIDLLLALNNRALIFSKRNNRAPFLPFSTATRVGLETTILEEI